MPVSLPATEREVETSSNAADWKDVGALDAINHSTIPEVGKALEVEVKPVSGNVLEVRPRRVAEDETFPSRDLALRESADALTLRQMTEQGTMPSERNLALRRRLIDVLDAPQALPAGPLIKYRIRPNVAAAVTGDRVLALRDTFESEWACKSCNGKGHTDEQCRECGGNRAVDGRGCGNCRVLGYGNETPYPSGFSPCRACNGSGWRGGIVIPDQAKSEPITGVIVSVGPEVPAFDSSARRPQLGDRILFSRYAGHNISTPDGSTYVMLPTREIMCLLFDVETANA